MSKAKASNLFPSGRALRVLIVEDDAADAELAMSVLKRAGYPLAFDVIDSATDFEERLAHADYDAILCDHNLGAWTGMEALEILKKSGKDIPFLVLTAVLGDEAAVEYVKRGASDYLLKDRLERLPVALSCALRDKANREALRASEAQFRRFIENLPLGVYRSTPDGRVQMANPALLRMLGYDSWQELAFQNLEGEAFEAGYPRSAFCEQIEREGEARGLETAWKRRDGSMVFVRESARAFRTDDGRVLYYDGIVEDVTERRRLEEELRQAQKMEAVGRLAGGVAHDFNNLLTIIMGYSDLLLERVSARDGMRPPVEEIKKAAERAASLTRQLLAFSRKQMLQPQLLDLNRLLTNVDEMLRRMIGEDIELATHLPSGLGRVKADPGQIEQVIMNLVVNSRDAMPEGGKITIETANVDLDKTYARSHPGATPGPQVMLAVSDTGMGMGAETLTHIFEPFFTTKETGKGTGLGLATVYGIVKQSAGSIWAYSEPGRGSTFKIYLPRVDKTAREAEPAKARSELAKGSETILVVEDEEGVRSLVCETLASHGYKVLEARGADQALTIFEQYAEPIHLLLTDVVMPQVGGKELAKRLSTVHPEAKVLYMSGYTDNAIVRHGVLEGGTPFLQKPFVPRTLVQKVREVLDTRLQDQQ